MFFLTDADAASHLCGLGWEDWCWWTAANVHCGAQTLFCIISFLTCNIHIKQIYIYQCAWLPWQYRHLIALLLDVNFTSFLTVWSNGRVGDVESLWNILKAAEPELRPCSDVLISGNMEPMQEPFFITDWGLKLFRTCSERGDSLVTSLQPAKMSWK